MYAVFNGSLAKAAAMARYFTVQSSPDRLRSCSWPRSIRAALAL
jgi:hypothetical protein